MPALPKVWVQWGLQTQVCKWHKAIITSRFYLCPIQQPVHLPVQLLVPRVMAKWPFQLPVPQFARQPVPIQWPTHLPVQLLVPWVIAKQPQQPVPQPAHPPVPIQQPAHLPVQLPVPQVMAKRPLQPLQQPVHLPVQPPVPVQPLKGPAAAPAQRLSPSRVLEVKINPFHPIAQKVLDWLFSQKTEPTLLKIDISELKLVILLWSMVGTSIRRKHSVLSLFVVFLVTGKLYIVCLPPFIQSTLFMLVLRKALKHLQLMFIHN